MLVNFKRLKGWDFFLFLSFFVVLVLFCFVLIIIFFFLGGGGSFKQWTYMGVGEGAYLWKKVI